MKNKSYEEKPLVAEVEILKSWFLTCPKCGYKCKEHLTYLTTISVTLWCQGCGSLLKAEQVSKKSSQ